MTEQALSPNKVVAQNVGEKAAPKELEEVPDEVLRHLVEMSPFGIYMVDADFRVMLVSEGAQKVFANVRPLIGRDFASVIHTIWPEPFASRVISIFRHTLETGEPHREDNTVETRRDTEADESYDWKVERITLYDGRVCVVCHFYDLSERHQYEAELHDKEQRLRLATETSSVGIWEWNLRTNEFRWDGQMFKIYGVPPTPGGILPYEDWVGTVLPEAVRDKERFVREILRHQSANRRFFQINRRDNGEPRYIQAMKTVLNNELGEPEWLIGTSLDATERERSLLALEQSEQRYRAAAATASDVIWTNNAEGLMEGDQTGWGNFTGQSHEELQGYGWTKSVHPEDRQSTIEAWNRAVEEKSTFNFQHRIRRHDGAWRICSVRAVPIFNANDTIREWVGVHKDITDQRQHEDELRQVAAQLSDAHRRKDEFLATLAHELRNPLAPMRNGLQIMKLAGDLPSSVEETRCMIERQLSQLVRLVDDLLDVSRISQGKLVLRKEPVHLSTILTSATETSGLLIEQMDQELTISLPEQPLIVDADMTRLSQVFLNLLNNASKYGERGSKICVTVERQVDAVLVKVADTGSGIAAEQIPFLFDMFTQVDRSLEKSQGGLGVGLTLVKRLVEMHDGTVEARSEGLGKGSEFIVRLPLLNGHGEVKKSTDITAVKEVLHNKSSYRVLVVDDNRDSANTLSRILGHMGNDICTAYDGKEGLDAAKEFRPDVVILDIGLPILNGYEVCRRIREQPWGADIMVIAVTGWGQDEDRRRAQEAGFDHHMVKPVDTQILKNLLSDI